MQLLYEGKAKNVFKTDENNKVLISFKDDATAFNGVKKNNFEGKGRVNLLFTRYFFKLLQKHNIPNHIIEFIDENSLLAHKVDIIPLEVVVRNLAAGSICRRLGFAKGFIFNPPLVEFYLKNDALNDPILCPEHLKYLGFINEKELEIITDYTLKINSIISEKVASKDITLVDFKLEFGKNESNQILLADEISPDTCRFWKKGTTESLDKDIYREDKGDLVETYFKLANILEITE
jgi:phosphoribosylaminoimidazole-succinocarboxamide synthase